MQILSAEAPNSQGCYRGKVLIRMIVIHKKYLYNVFDRPMGFLVMTIHRVATLSEMVIFTQSFN